MERWWRRIALIIASLPLLVVLLLDVAVPIREYLLRGHWYIGWPQQFYGLKMHDGILVTALIVDLLVLLLAFAIPLVLWWYYHQSPLSNPPNQALQLTSTRATMD